MYQALRGRQIEFFTLIVFFYGTFYTFHFKPSQQLFVAMFILRHRRLPVILHNLVRVLLGYADTHKARKSLFFSKRQTKNGGCGDAGSRIPAV